MRELKPDSNESHASSEKIRLQLMSSPKTNLKHQILYIR